MEIFNPHFTDSTIHKFLTPFFMDLCWAVYLHLAFLET
uniref:Uncharacterized protein n=1 Tax=Anguilla anguilla TaxID=7936 RepID=A0A0E9PWF0_ANGAN